MARKLYAAGGYSAVTVRAVAEEVGITSGAIYKHFTSKEALFRALQRRALELFVEMASRDRPGDPLGHLRLYFWRYYEFSRQYPEYFTMLWADASVPPLDDTLPEHGPSLHRLGEDTDRRIARCVEAGLIPEGRHGEIARYLWATMHGCAVLQMEKRWNGPDQWVSVAIDTSLLAVRTGLFQLHDRLAPTDCDVPLP